MVIYYGFFGLIADLALVVNLLPHVCHTLGIAGDPHAAGHRRHRADDRSGDRFQRSDLRADREETRLGRTPIAAVDTGFREALR